MPGGEFPNVTSSFHNQTSMPQRENLIPAADDQGLAAVDSQPSPPRGDGQDL